MKKKIIIIIFSTLLSLTLVGFFVGNYFYNLSLNTKINKDSVSNQDKEEKVDLNYENNKQWLANKYIEIKTKSTIGKDIYAYKYINEKSNDWVILVHGYTNSAEKMATFIRKVYEMGYNVLAMDLLGHGKSENDFITMGGIDSKDLSIWINNLSKEYKDAKIYLYGVSMGAATVMNTLDENLPHNVKAFIEDSGYISLKDEFSYQLKKLYKLPSFPILNFASIVSKIRAGFYLEDVDAKKALQSTNLSALILHGKEDTFVPVDNAYKIYELINSKNKQIYIFENMKHVKAYYLEEDTYWNLIENFLKNN